MDTFWDSGQEGEKTLVQVCLFVSFVGYPPYTKTCPWGNYPAIDGCLNQERLYLSLSFFSSPSL